MPRRPTDISGQTFGNLRTIEPLNEVNRSGQRLWRFECTAKRGVGECGNVVVLPAVEVKRGNNVSCGCVKKARNRAIAMQRFKLREAHKGAM